MLIYIVRRGGAAFFLSVYTFQERRFDIQYGDGAAGNAFGQDNRRGDLRAYQRQNYFYGASMGQS